MAKRSPGPWKTQEEFTGRPRKLSGKWVLPTSGYCTWKRSQGKWYVSGSKNLSSLRQRLSKLVSSGKRPSDTPTPSVTWVPLKMTGVQKWIYDLALDDFVAYVNESGKWTPQKKRNAFIKIGTMRAICTMSPITFLHNRWPEGWSSPEAGAKQAWLRDHLLPNLHRDDKLILFSEWVRTTAETSRLCERAGFSTAHYHGRLSRKRRQCIQKEWNDGKYQIIVLSPAGYNTINLHKPVSGDHFIYTVHLDVPQYYKVQQRVGRSVRHGLQGKPIVLFPYIQESIELEWAKFAAQGIIPDIEKLFGESEAKELYAPLRSR